MKTLTPSIAQQIAKDIAPQITDKSMSEFFWAHSANVVKIAKILGKQQNIDIETLEIAGRIHDIGYCKNIDQHRDFAIPILEDLNYEVNDIIKDCILHHGFQDNPTTTE